MSKKKKPTKKKAGRSKADRRSPKRRKFVAGLIDGKSMRKAALDAGYSQSMANDAGRKILPGAQSEFQYELEQKVPRGALIQRLAEGLNAKETKLTQYEGEFTDQKHLVSFSERRRYVELIAKLQGLLVERVEVGNKDDAPLNFNLNVQFTDNPDEEK